jgi:hypothetical protein
MTTNYFYHARSDDLHSVLNRTYLLFTRRDAHFGKCLSALLSFTEIQLVLDSSKTEVFCKVMEFSVHSIAVK